MTPRRPANGPHPPAALHRRRYRRVVLAMALLWALPALAQSSGVQSSGVQSSLARVGDPAPSFTLSSIDGRKVSLADFRGKYVVLEWWNSECYAVNTHYGAGAMQAAQRKARADGAIWLSIDSTHPAHPSFVDAKRAVHGHRPFCF